MVTESRIFTSLIQSDFTRGGHGNFEVVIQTAGELRHWYRDLNDRRIWVQAQVVATGAAGAGSIIQSDFRGEDGHGNLEVVVPLRNAAGGMDLWHYFRENSDVSTPWRQAQMVAANVAGPGSLIQSDFRGEDGHGNFEVVVPLPRGDGLQLRHFFRENSDVSTAWRTGQFITDSCSGWASLIQSDFGSGGHGNFEVLIEECSQSIVSYWHPNSEVALPWLRHRVLLGEPVQRRVASTTRICQLTGEWDRAGWDGNGKPPTPTIEPNRRTRSAAPTSVCRSLTAAAPTSSSAIRGG